MAIAKAHVKVEINRLTLLWGWRYLRSPWCVAAASHMFPLQGWHSSLALSVPLAGASFPSSKSKKRKGRTKKQIPSRTTALVYKNKRDKRQTQYGKYISPSSAINSRTPQCVTRPAERLLSSNNIGYSMCKYAGGKKIK